MPERRLKERTRYARFLIWERKCGIGPEMFVQLITRNLSLGIFVSEGGIWPTRLGILWRRRFWRCVRLARDEGMVPVRESWDAMSRPMTRLVVSLHLTPYQSQQSKAGSHEGNGLGFVKLFLNAVSAALSLG